MHSLQEAPKPIIFDYDDPIVNQIKADKKAYKKVLDLIREQLRLGKMQGEIITGKTDDTKVNFEEKGDLYFALHGIKKIKYITISGDQE